MQRFHVREFSMTSRFKIGRENLGGGSKHVQLYSPTLGLEDLSLHTCSIVQKTPEKGL